jgi:hypothetical protein
VKFRRKAQEPGADELADLGAEAEPGVRAEGPFDSEELAEDDGVERVDLGSLLIAPEPQRELRLQVDQASGAVQSIVLGGPDGALEVRAFAAPRDYDLWSEVRPQIAAEVAQAGGIATERQGPWGTELICEVGRGSADSQVTRVVGINGPRWMIRVSLIGAGATRPDEARDWEDSIRRLTVHRGAQAMPSGEALPVVMPPQARRVDQNGQ